MALLAQPLDKHIVDATMHVAAALQSLSQLDLRKVPQDRREHVRAVREALDALRNDLRIVRIGSEDHERRARSERSAVVAELNEELAEAAAGTRTSRPGAPPNGIAAEPSRRALR